MRHTSYKMGWVFVLVFVLFVMSVAQATAGRNVSRIKRKIKAMKAKQTALQAKYNKTLQRRVSRRRLEDFRRNMGAVRDKINSLTAELAAELAAEEKASASPVKGSSQGSASAPVLTEDQQEDRIKKRQVIEAQLQEYGKQKRALMRELYETQEDLRELIQSNASEFLINQKDSDAQTLRREILRLEKLEIELDRSS